MPNGIDDIFHLEDEESEQCKITLADPCSYFISTSSYHKDIELSGKKWKKKKNKKMYDKTKELKHPACTLASPSASPSIF